MFGITQHPQCRCNSLCGSQVVLRMVLMVTLWQGPIPVWHSHGTLKNSAVSSEMFSWFTGHLRFSHPAVDPSADIEFGWHAHLDWPRVPAEGDSHEQLSFADEFYAGNFEYDLQSEDAATSQFSGLGECLRLPDRSQLATLADRPSGFFGSFAATLAVPMRFGIARC